MSIKFSVRRPLCSFAFGACALLVPLSGLAQSAAAGGYYDDAVQRLGQGDAAGAVIQLKNALQQDRGMLAAHLLLGRTYLQQGELVAAEAAFNEALRLGVNRAEVAAPLARIHLLRGKPQEVVDAVPAEGLPPAARVEVLTLRGTAFAALGRKFEATDSFAQARAVDPASPVPLVAEVSLQLASGDLEAAQRLAARAVELGPDVAAAHNARASAFHAAGDLAQALRDYARAIELQPGLIDAVVARAGILLDLGRGDEALAMLDATEGTAAEPRAAYLRAVIASARGDLEAARRHLAETAQIVDALPAEWLTGQEQILMAGALAHHAGRQFEKARKYLDVLAQRYPRNLGARKLLASIYLEEGDLARATGLLERVLKDGPEDAQAIFLMGRVMLAQRRYARASEFLDQAAQAGVEGARAALGFSRFGQGDVVAAIAEMRLAFERSRDLGVGIALANLLMRQAARDEALGVARAALAAQPENPLAHNLVGALQAARGQRAEARSAYQRALELDTGFTPARLNLARLDVSEGRIDAARRTYTDMLRKDHRDVVAMYELALLEERAGNTAESVRWLEKAALESPADRRIGLALVRARRAAGDLPGALEAAKALAARQGADLQVLEVLTRLQLELGETKAAQQSLREMTRLAEFDADAQIRIGYLQLDAANPAGARYSADKALGGRPGDVRATILAAEAALAAGDLPSAGKLAAELAQAAPGSAAAHALTGDVALAAGRRPDAAQAYRAALRLEPSGAVLLGLVRTLLPDDREATVKVLEDWLREHDQDVPAQKALAELHMRDGDWQAAARILEKLEAIAGDDPLVLNNRAYVLDKLGDPRALALAERAHALAPSRAEVLDTYGWLLARQGQREAGLHFLREARLRQPASVEVRYHLAHVLHALGRTAEARAELADRVVSTATVRPPELQALLRELEAGR